MKPSKYDERKASWPTAMMRAEKAPNFDLPTDGGGRVRLSDFAGSKVVVYFYPKDDTTGCTLEAIDFTKAEPGFCARPEPR